MKNYDQYPVVAPQRYLSYVDENPQRWKELVNHKVLHYTLGMGIVLNVRGESPIIEVCFDNAEGKVDTRKFAPESFIGEYFTEIHISAELLRAIELEEQRREQEKLKFEEKQRQERHRENVLRYTNQALPNNFGETLSTPVLNAQDIQLALSWSNSTQLRQEITPANIDETVIHGEYGKHWELGRVLSARAAEKAVIDFYRRHRRTVSDISVTQITQRGSMDWKDCDLIIDDEPIDVKNSRTSAENRNSYVEHCVPKFKQDRTNTQVKIAGVLSPYLWPSTLLDPEDTSHVWRTPIRFLGVTTFDTVNALKKEFEIPQVFSIELKRPGHGISQFLPPWIFDYPMFLYEKRDRALQNIANQPLLEYKDWEQCDVNPVPIYLAAGGHLLDKWDRSSLSNWEWDVVARISKWQTQHGLSLPFLYLTILTHFLEMVRHPHPDYRPILYTRLLCYDKNYTKPLFIHDPLETIHNLIKTLDDLWHAEHDFIKEFRIFRLQGLNILRGRYSSKDAQWTTLIAYCGGWTVDKIRCGNTPLVLGNCERCEECGKLICPKCRFCSKNCSMYHKRLSVLSDSSSMDA